MFSLDLEAIIILSTQMNESYYEELSIVCLTIVYHSLLPGSEFIGLLLHSFFPHFGAECSQTSCTETFGMIFQPKRVKSENDYSS